MSEIGDRYIELVKRSVNGDVQGLRTTCVPVQPAGTVRRWLSRKLTARGLVLARVEHVPESAYLNGVGWPRSRSNVGESMIGRARLDNVHSAVDSVITERIPGDLIETGVWRGGATILMRAVLAARGVRDRTVFAADSFEGLPSPTIEGDDAGLLHFDRTLAVSVAQVQENFRRYGLLDDQVRFVEGWFRDTLPALRQQHWAVIRLDGDMYESTMDGLTNLYPGLSTGGWLIVDDYGTYDSCRRAVDDYRRGHEIADVIVDIDGNGAYWRKS